MDERYLKVWGGQKHRYLEFPQDSYRVHLQELPIPFSLHLGTHVKGNPAHTLLGMLLQVMGVNPNHDLAVKTSFPRELERAFLEGLPELDGEPASFSLWGQWVRQDRGVLLDLPLGGSVQAHLSAKGEQRVFYLGEQVRSVPYLQVNLQLPASTWYHSCSLTVRLDHPRLPGPLNVELLPELGRWALQCFQHVLDWVPVIMAYGSWPGHVRSDLVAPQNLVEPDWERLSREERLLWALRSPIPPLALRAQEGGIVLEPRWRCPWCPPLSGPERASPRALLEHFRTGRHLAHITGLPKKFVLAQSQMAEISGR
jgi:hypothetical protein